MIGFSSVAGLQGERDSCHISCSASPSCTAAKGEMYFEVKHISMDMDNGHDVSIDTNGKT